MNIKKKCDQIDSLLGDLSATGISPIPDLVFHIRRVLSEIREVEQPITFFEKLIPVVRRFMKRK